MSDELRASGGPVSPGRVYLVGESGPDCPLPWRYIDRLTRLREDEREAREDES